AGCIGISHAQLITPLPGGYPSRPIRIIVVIAPGGGLDAVSRVAGQLLTDKFGQTVVVDNRAGGGTVIATDIVANAAPDGYTLLSGTDTLMLVGAMKRVRYDIRTAFEPVVQMTSQWYVLVTNPALQVKSVKELIALAKAKPDALSYASQGMGTTGHLAVDRFATMTDIKLVHVPYKGSAAGMLDVIAGQVHLMMISTLSAAAQARSGKLRGIAITSPQRVAYMPDMPTLAESGVPGYRVSNTYGLYAPAGTPRPIVEAINSIVGAGMRTPDMVKRLAADGTEPAAPATPAEFKAFIAKEYAQVEKQVKTLDLKN
ncbi:MAG TPA: tripartite tricarboxylate transporter substrate binding protein, partial [Burkholderiales bacterium]|nr:tripartite tricarboxylate transporter substrate binding protein [Burkholderiales bacterium]